MDRDFLIQLTNNLYRLTLLFPKKEPLRYKMRELATDILANALRQEKIGVGSLFFRKEVEILDGFFEVAKAQNWVSPAELLVIQEEYDKLKKESEWEVSSVIQEGSQIGSRQEKILEFLKKQGKAQVWQVQQIFPGLTKRTLRRDFEQMLNQGIIERIGERNETFYQIKG